MGSTQRHGCAVSRSPSVSVCVVYICGVVRCGVVCGCGSCGETGLQRVAEVQAVGVEEHREEPELHEHIVHLGRNTIVV